MAATVLAFPGVTVTEQDKPVRLERWATRLKNRQLVETTIEYLIAVLDAIDGDCDLEDDDPVGGNPDDEGERADHAGLPMPIWGDDQTVGYTNAHVLKNYYFDEVLNKNVLRFPEAV